MKILIISPCFNLLMRSRARYGHFMIIHDLCDLVHLKKPPWRSDAFLKGLEGLESGLSEASWIYFYLFMLKTGWFDRF